jgi:hypothetical protein
MNANEPDPNSPPPQSLKDVLHDFRGKEDALREEIRQELALREQHIRMNLIREDEESRQHLETRLRNRLFREEEDRFFTERGFVRYVNRYGQTEWVPPEEAAKRRQLRRREFISNLFTWQHSRKRMKQLGIVAALLVAGIIAWILVRQSLRHGPMRYGGLMVQSEGIAGAQIYLDGQLMPSQVTPARLLDVPVGAHVVVVAKEGFTTKPPVARVLVTSDEDAMVKFELANVPFLGRIALDANLPSDLTLYVDGQPCTLDDQRELLVPVGGHVFTPVRAGYLASPPWRRVMVQRGETVRLAFQFQPRPDLGTLKVSCTPPEGAVYVNGAYTGLEANGTAIFVPPGPAEVVVVNNGWRLDPLRQVIHILPGSRHELQCRAYPTDTTRTTAILTRTAGANIILDGRWLPFVTPMPELPLSPGEHYLNLYHQGRWLAEDDRRLNPETPTSGQLPLEF